MDESGYNSVKDKPTGNGIDMRSTPIWDPKKDILLSPGNAALILIDYQPPQVSTVDSMDRQTLT